MTAVTPTLLELQRAIHRSLAQGEDGEISADIVADGTEPAERLSIYRGTFESTLTAALRLSFPAVHRLVGSEFFEGAARLFIKEQLPRSSYLDEYGAGFPEFLERFAPAKSLVYLDDVAQLEWAVNRALHAPDAEPLDVRRLLHLSDADRACVRFVPHPSVGLLHCEHPADTIWHAVLEQDDPALAAVDLSGEAIWLLVQRLPAGVDVSRIGEAAWRFSARLYAGQPLHALLQEFPGLEIDALLGEHLAAGRLVGFNLPDSTLLQPQRILS